jgi:hypothetical protein
MSDSILDEYEEHAEEGKGGRRIWFMVSWCGLSVLFPWTCPGLVDTLVW